MAHDEVLARRISDLLEGEPGVTSRKVFGGLGLMVEGHLAVAAASSGALMVRADPAACEAWPDRGVRFVRTLPPKPPSP